MLKKRQYTEKAIRDAVQYVKDEKGSVRQAAKLYNVPRSSIQFKIKNPETKFKSGPSPVLSDAEEIALSDFILTQARRGFPRKKEDVKNCVQVFLKDHPRPNPFKNDRPGDAWFRAFLKRHPSITTRVSEGVTNASACVSESDIRKWFHEIYEYICEVDLSNAIQDPKRVFNGDETGFHICPSTGKVLAEKGSKNVYQIEKSSSKENITVMFSFSAAGLACNPMIIYPYKRIPDRIVESVPAGWGIGRSDTGWMTAAVFYEYIANVFSPQLVANDIPRPVILFVDGHKTHLSIEVSELCKRLEIHLIALYPNATRILQPADVAAFQPIKAAWKKGLRDWYTANNYEVALSKLTFAPLLERVLQNASKESTLVHGFRITGLFPFDANNVDYTKCLATKYIPVYEKTTDMPMPTLTYNNFCDKVGEEILKKCEAVATKPSVKYDENFKAIYRLWSIFQNPESVSAIEATDTHFIDASESPSILRTLEEETSWQNLATQDNGIKENDSQALELRYDDVTDETVLDETTGELKEQNYIEDMAPTATNKKFENFSNETTKTHSPVLVRREAFDDQKPSTSASSFNENKKITVLSDEPLAHYLRKNMWPESPKRKGKREIERLPYALTSDSYLHIMKTKQEKKLKEQIEKNNRKRLREEKKLEKENRTIIFKKNKITTNSKDKKRTQTTEKPEQAKLETVHSRQGDKVLTTIATENLLLEPSMMCYACTGKITKKILECDYCHKLFHKNCIPTFHRQHIPTEDDDEFLCHLCYRLSNTDSSDSTDSLYDEFQREANIQGFSN